MRAFLAVVDDLIQFAGQALFGSQTVRTQIPTDATVSVKALPATAPPPPHEFVRSAVTDFRVGESYFVGTTNAPLYLDPVITFDNACCVVPYGQKLMLHELRGRWAAVQFDDQQGWVLKDVLVARLVDVYPQLAAGRHYSADDPETVKLRACIDDEFGGAASGYPLNAAEYVYYRLIQSGCQLAWGATRFRIAGTWQRKLRGLPGVHVGVHPKTGAVMEYIRDDIGYLAYVDVVYPDESIKVSEVGVIDEGVYSERELSTTDWRTLRPVFIRVQ